jgi:protocatechuate 3,4-dioxygenase, alpha subunit
MRECGSGSQTVGPFFRIGLEYLSSCPSSEISGEVELVRVRGQVFDANRDPVPDAMLELWYADPSGEYAIDCASGDDQTFSQPRGFARVATDEQGRFSVAIPRPGPVSFDGDQVQAPHAVVLVFARGLLRHLITRVYFPDPSVASDPVLQLVPEDRRATLIAQPESHAPANAPGNFLWDVVLQGEGETVFFAW